MPRLAWRPFARVGERNARLPLLLGGCLALLVLCVWDPVARPGPVLCSARRLLGIPCPLCGATRGVALCLRGRPLEASTYNPLSVPVVLAAVFLLARWSAEYLSGQRLEVHLTPAARSLILLAVPIGLTVTWVYLLLCRREDDFSTTWLGRLVGLFW